MGKKFRRNHSILHGFLDTGIFVFCNYCEKFENSRVTIFGETTFLKIGFTTLQRYPMGQKFRQNCSISHGFPDTGVYVFCNFCEKFKNSEKPPVDSADTRRVKNFVKITLSRSISEINAFLRLTQKIKMAAKSGGKTIFGKSCQ